MNGPASANHIIRNDTFEPIMKGGIVFVLVGVGSYTEPQKINNKYR